MIADCPDGLGHAAFETEGIIAARFLDTLLGRQAMRQCIADEHVERCAIVGRELVRIVHQLCQEDVPITGLAGSATNVANQESSGSVDFEGKAIREDFQRRRGPPCCHPQLMHVLGIPPRFSQGVAQAVAHAFQSQRQGSPGSVDHGRCRREIANPLALKHVFAPSVGMAACLRLLDSRTWKPGP